MFYIYIIYSPVADKFYTGYSNDPHRRLVEHNSISFNTYTSKFRPWVIKAIFSCGSDEAQAITIEKFIKRQKSSKLLQTLCDPTFTPTGVLAQFVRVPDFRD